MMQSKECSPSIEAELIDSDVAELQIKINLSHAQQRV